MTAEPKTAPLDALVDLLGRHRVVLFGAYILLLVGLVVIVANASFLFLPAVFHNFSPGGNDTDWDWDYISEAALVLGPLLLLQALFLFGGGRVPIGRQTQALWRTIAPIGVAGLALVPMLLTFGIALAEIFDRTDSEGSIRESAIFGIETFEPSAELWIWMSIVWLVWLVVAVALFRHDDQESLLRKLTSILLAGSWVEFLVALPVDLAIRQRADSCVCATGSWFALLAAIPVMLFAFGPALYLLYLRELRLGRAQPNRAALILLHRSRWQTSGAPGDPDE